MAGSASVSGGSTSTSPQDENFVRRLIDAVKGQPCLYNPSHEHYGNKHSSAQFRCKVWQKLCVEIGFTDAHALQMQWKRVRDRYVRERKKRRSVNANETGSHQEGGNSRERHPSGGSTCSTSSGSTNSAASRHYEMMRWIEPYLIDVPNNNNNNSTTNSGSNNGQPNHIVVDSASNGPVTAPQSATNQQITGQNGGVMSIVVTTSGGGEPVTYYMNDPAGTRNDNTQPVVVSSASQGIVINNYDQQTPQQQQSGQQQQQTTPSQHDYASQPNSTSRSNGGNGNTKSPQTQSSANASPCSSTTSSEIDVGSVNTFANQQQTQQMSQQSNMVVLTPVSQPQRPPPQQVLYAKTEPQSQPRIGEPMQTSDGSVVTVTARGTAPMATILKKDLNVRTNDGGTVTMIIDPTTFYQHGSQKMYRLVNVSELNASDMVQMSGGQVGTSTSDVKLIPTRRKRVSTMGMPNGRGQLGDDLILDDGISEKTVTIDQILASQSPMSNERILIDHQPVMTVGTSNVMLAQPNIHQVHHQQHASTSQQHGGLTAGGHSIIHHNAGMGVRHHSQQGQQSGGQRFMSQPLTVQQPQYTLLSPQPIQTQMDADLAFANSIATHLSRLNEDEKAVAKMNIQRILMDARFGMGACARMIHDEELNEAAASSANHDVVTVQQHVDNSNRRHR